MTGRPFPAALLFVLAAAVGPPGFPGEPSSAPHDWRDLPGPVTCDGRVLRLHPDTLAADPGMPSPSRCDGGVVTLTARLRDGRFALVPVTPTAGQRRVDAADFPVLARTGLHDGPALLEKASITGRSIEEITRLARPGGLSTAGFLAADEEFLAVLAADNDTLTALGLTHAELAEPLFHVLNLLASEIGFVYPTHSWGNLEGFLYGGRTIFVSGEATKGGQQSIFDDGIEGAWDVDLRREPDDREEAFLRERYRDRGEGIVGPLLEGLSHIHTGEMVPQYVMRYGFYEGHTDYRADPLAIAFIFGLRTVEEIEAAFPGRLPQRLGVRPDGG